MLELTPGCDNDNTSKRNIKRRQHLGEFFEFSRSNIYRQAQLCVAADAGPFLRFGHALWAPLNLRVRLSFSTTGFIRRLARHHMRINEAVSEFEQLVARAGFAVLREESPLEFGSSVTRIRNEDGELRLVWDGKQEYLNVQISHGPPKGEAGWLELWGLKCTAGAFIENPDADVTFMSAAEYGVELMSPQRSPR